MQHSAAPLGPKVVLKRRKQVKIACGNCRRAKTACDESRPCKRCVSLGITAACKDSGKNIVCKQGLYLFQKDRYL